MTGVGPADVSPPCPVCQVATTGVVPYADPHWPDEGLFSQLEIHFCGACGLGFSVPEIPQGVLSRFYEQVYRRRGGAFYLDFEHLAQPTAFDLRSISQILLAKHFATFAPDDVFVDIGPGNGASFGSAGALLRRPRLVGVELTPGASDAYARLYGAETVRDLDSLRGLVPPPKIVLCSHSIEHFSRKDLAACSAGVRALLHADGVLVVEVPHVDMRVHESLRLRDSPHLLFFSTEGLRRLFEGFGFEVLFVDTCGETYRDWFATATAPAPAAPAGARAAVSRVLQALPGPIRTPVKRIYGTMFRQMDLRSPQFDYGGDRTCLRLVARRGEGKAYQ